MPNSRVLCATKAKMSNVLLKRGCGTLKVLLGVELWRHRGALRHRGGTPGPISLGRSTVRGSEVTHFYSPIQPPFIFAGYIGFTSHEGSSIFLREAPTTFPPFLLVFRCSGSR
jgi:hypothetical protein